MATYALLLRGVNVGGRGALSMSLLRDVLTDLGYDDVRTYLQSGNAVVRTTTAARQLNADVEAALEKTTGRKVGVLVRSHKQLQDLVDGWPFVTGGAATTKHVIFLSTASDAKPLSELSAGDYEPERFKVVGAHVYLSLPNGLGRSKLTPIVTRKLAKTVTTARNWNTVTALTEMTAG